MKKLKFLVYSLPILGIITISYSFIAPTIENKVCDNSDAGVELKTGMRKLWEDHVTWTRNVIFNIMDDLPGTDEAVKRLLKNQDDIGNAIKPYYGEDAGKKLTELLHTHITQAADLLKAAKKDDNAAFEKVNKMWKENADEIAMFLSKANPNWKLDGMKKMMQDHLHLTTDEAVARKKKDYPADVMAYDKVHDEILEMSDMLAMGIVQQFPDKFKSKAK
jgi:transcription termination factor NusB